MPAALLFELDWRQSKTLLTIDKHRSNDTSSTEPFFRSVILSNVHLVEICFVEYFRRNILCPPGLATICTCTLHKTF